MNRSRGFKVRPASPHALRLIAAVILVLGALLAVTFAGAQEDATLSPYFLITEGEGDAEAFPLKSTAVHADLGGVIADVRVVQVYENGGSVPIEAVYVFPASTRAAVHGMTVRLGDRVLVAQIREREQARAEYEEARDEGLGAALLEQERSNVFMMSVANILPGDVVEVELSYTELLVPDKGEYAFTFPTVTGPRYGEESFNANPYLGEGEDAPYDFDITVNLNTGMELASLHTPGHDTLVESTTAGSVTVRFAEHETGGNRDFVLRYRPGGDALSSGLLLQPDEDGDGGWFLVMAQPPARQHIVDLPSDYLFVIDVSGSMAGFPLETANALLNELLESLTPGDTFNILLFSGSSQLLAPESLPMTADSVRRARSFVRSAHGAGGTELLGALSHALSLPRSELAATSIVVITDGYVTVEREAFELIRNSLGEANLFAFGIGSSVNHALIEGLARAGSGEPFTVLNSQEAPAVARRLREYVSSPVLTDIEVRFDGLRVSDVEPPSLPDLMAERPVLVYGRYEGEAGGSVTVSGRTASGQYGETFDVASDATYVQGSPLSYLWARETIARLGDYVYGADSQGVKDEIIRLGLEFSLLSDFTSFVAVDSVVRSDGTSTQVRQPLPLPAGVPNTAVGGYGPATFATTHGLPVPPAPLADVAEAGREGPAYVSIDDLHVTGIINELSARAVLERAFEDLLVCLARGESVRAQLIHEAPGVTRVVDIEPLAGDPDRSAQVCMAVVLEGLRFDAPGTLTVELSVR